LNKEDLVAMIQFIQIVLGKPHTAAPKNSTEDPQFKMSIAIEGQGSCPESLVAHGQARLFGVAGSNPPGSVSTSLSDSSVSVSISLLEVLSPLRIFF